MYCRNCGNELSNNASICTKCGFRPLTGYKYCQNCGSQTKQKQVICIKCGAELQGETSVPADSKSKVAAGVLG